MARTGQKCNTISVRRHTRGNENLQLQKDLQQIKEQEIDQNKDDPQIEEEDDEEQEEIEEEEQELKLTEEEKKEFQIEKEKIEKQDKIDLFREIEEKNIIIRNQHNPYFPKIIDDDFIHNGVDPDDYIDQDLKVQMHYSNKQLDMIEDMTELDKVFFKLWNTFMILRRKALLRQNKIIIRSENPGFIKEFMQENQEILINKLSSNFIVHLNTLQQYGIISMEDNIEIMQQFVQLDQEFCTENDVKLN